MIATGREEWLHMAQDAESQIARLQNQIDQERRARYESERLLEDMASELTITNRCLQSVVSALEQEITARTAALTQALASTEDHVEQLRAICSQSPAGLVLIDHTGKVKFANSAFQKMTGLSAPEIIGRESAQLEAMLFARAESHSNLHELFEDCGSHAYRLSMGPPLNNVIEFVGVSSDAATVSRLLYARDVTHEVEVDRMKSEFLAHAAHELRTPMASIYGFTELLMHQEFDAVDRRELLETIHKQTNWLVHIINELLDLARIEARRGKDFLIEGVSLAILVDEVVRALNIDRSRWPLEVVQLDDLPQVSADRAKLRQVLTNVIGNAVKYSPDGGAIEIHGILREHAGGSQAGIAVCDHGMGMMPEQAARVCERFYRADTSGNIPGTGLGMAIVKEVVELLGGSIGISSAPGLGTTVTLLIPVAPE